MAGRAVIEMVEAGHPVPDEAGLDAAARTLELADGATEDDLVLVLMSGGASANWIAPAHGLSLAEKQAVTRALLRSGANIGEINTVRKHLSRIKGGRLARHAHPARLVTLGISDVPGDDPAVIGSGPTVPDPTTLADARAIVARFKLDLPARSRRALDDPDNESPKPGDPVFAGDRISARRAAGRRVRRRAQGRRGAPATNASFSATGSKARRARLRPRRPSWRANSQRQGRRAVILSGGELTVTIRGQGRGGPNQEFALALAIALDGAPGIAALGRRHRRHRRRRRARRRTRPGPSWTATSAGRARALGLDPAPLLADNNSTAFFADLGDLIAPGPTYTNVNDFRAIWWTALTRRENHGKTAA